MGRDASYSCCAVVITLVKTKQNYLKKLLKTVRTTRRISKLARQRYASPFWRGFINAEETNRLQSILKKTIRRSYLPHDFKSLDEVLDSTDHALFRVIARNPLHVLHPLLSPRKRTVYNLRKLTHGLTIPSVCSSLVRKNFLIRMLYTDVY